MDTRKLIDYAMDENGVEFRSQLYASIHDRVTAAIESKKQEISQNLVTQESVVNEGLMTHITLGKKVKNDEGGHDQEVHYKGEKIGHISSYSHRTGTRYGMRHDASNDLTAGSRSPKEAIDDLRQSHAEYLKSIKESSDDVESMEKNKDDEAKERKKSSFPSGKGPSIFSKDKSSSGGKTTSPKSGVTRHSSGDRY
jgi:hypothetical protein